MLQAPPRAEALGFSATVLLSGKTTTGIEVPERIVTSLNGGKRPPVSTDVRAKAGVAAGDHTQVALELDTEPRTVTVPPGFARALANNPAAQDFFNHLSYSDKQRFVLSIEGAKTGETRQRRIAKAVAQLTEERR